MCGYFFFNLQFRQCSSQSSLLFASFNCQGIFNEFVVLVREGYTFDTLPQDQRGVLFFLPGHSTPHSTFYSTSHLNQHLIQFHFTRHSTSISISFHTSLNIQFHLYFILFKADNSLCTRQKAVGTHVNKRCMLWTIRKSDHAITYPICVTT